MDRRIPLALGLFALLLSSGMPAVAQSSTLAGAGLRTFSDATISFSYPSSWHAESTPYWGGGVLPLAYVSNLPLHRVCANDPRCRLPLKVLPPNSVLTEWMSRAFFGWTLAGTPGKPLYVGGLPARLQVLKPQSGFCPRRTVTMLKAVIDSGFPNNWYEFYACLSGPKLNAQYEAMMILFSLHPLYQYKAP